MIKVKSDTKTILENMKIVDKESFDEVIKRLILATSENEGSLTRATEKLLNIRLEMKTQGKAVSIKEIIEKMKKSKRKGNKNAREI